MLSDDELRKIAAEEHYRSAIRQRIETANPRSEQKAGFGRKIFEFFNSSLGTWLLSSVLLSGGAAMIQRFEHDHEIRQKNREQLAVYRMEIESRFDNMEFLLRRAKSVGEAKKALSEIFRSSMALTPELQNRSMGSLYMNIYSIVSGTAQEKAKEALDIVRQLEISEEMLQSKPDEHVLSDADKEQFKKLIQTVKAIHFSA